MTVVVPDHMRIETIDWNIWEPEMIATLMFVQDGEKVLLIRKLRGLGAGNINGPGGRIEPGETPEQCAIRETQEELCITPTGVKPAGELRFHAEDMPRILAYVFTATGHEGTPTETEEAIPLWFHKHEIPFEEMWQDDAHWLPQVLEGMSVKGRFSFVEETLLDMHLEFTGQ